MVNFLPPTYIRTYGCIPVELLQSVLLWAESQIAVFVEPQRERIPVSHDEPLAYVELGVVNQQRPLCNASMQFSEADFRWHNYTAMTKIFVYWPVFADNMGQPVPECQTTLGVTEVTDMLWTLVGGWQIGHPACRNTALPKALLFGRPMGTEPNLE